MIRDIRFSEEFDKAFKHMESVSDAFLDDIILKIDEET